MSISVQKISFTGNAPIQRDRKEKVQDAATVAGGTGFVAGASKIAGKKGLTAVTSAERGIRTTMDAATEAAELASRGIKEGSGYLSKFKVLSQKYYGDAIKFLSKFKDNKFIRPIIKSPVGRGIASVFGGTLAFFVLISGIAEAAESGQSAISDIKRRYGKIVNA